MSQSVDAENGDGHHRGSGSDEMVTVKFRTEADGETLTQAFDLMTDVGTLRSQLRRSLNADDPSKMTVERDGRALRDGQTLKELGATSLGIFELDVRGGGVTRRLSGAAYYLPTVDVITVNVAGCRRPLVVEIERCSACKPWLGGYRDAAAGRAYHHAAAQTDFRPRAYAHAVQVDGRTQTCVDRGTCGRAARDAAAQTRSADREYCGYRRLRARPYRGYRSRSPDDRALLAAVVTVQRAFRRMAARKRCRRQSSVQPQLSGSATDKTTAASPAARTTAQSSEVTAVTALESKQQHFCSLYTMIGKWWKRERQRIKGIEADNARMAAQMNLLKKEIKFLLEVEKQRSELKYELTKHDDVTFLNKTSKPRMFKTRAGKLLTVDTVGNQKARVLRDIYAGLQATAEGPGGPERRAGVLDRLCATVAASDYKYKKDLLAAVAMETDLTAMRADERNVRSVRSRVEQLFRHFIRQPDVNPEADAYYRPSERRVLNVYTCIRCKRNLAATDFSLESRVNRTNVCANCEWTEQVGHKRIDMAPYRRMLKALRHDEMQVAAYQSECFLMQPTEVYRLVSVVWKERSAIGESGQLNGLRLVRWRRHEVWSPWNCVLLTRAEAEAHCRLDGDPADCYDPRFVRWVANRHMMARLQFGNLVQAVKSRAAGTKAVKPLSKNWKSVADRFNINTCR